MSELREVLLVTIAGLLAISLLVFAYLFLGQTFTDAEIQESIVDSWEVNATLTAIALAIVIPLGLLAVPLLWRPTLLAKRLAIACAALCILNVALLVGNHAVLTERTTRLTGQHFGGALGLGLGPI